MCDTAVCSLIFLCAGSGRRRWHCTGLGLEQHPRLVVSAWRGVVLVQLEGEVRLCTLVDVELGDEVDLHPAYLARTVGHAVHELAEAPAEVLEAQEDGRADERRRPVSCAAPSEDFTLGSACEFSSLRYNLPNFYFYNGHAGG
jgi:hypothetical protein